MKILVVLWQYPGTDRVTIDEYIKSFSKYSGATTHYLNTFFGVPKFISSIKYDAVIFHYTFMSQKWGGEEYFEKLLSKCNPLKEMNSFKIALPQDEYVNSELVCKFLKDYRINLLGTCYYEEDWDEVYPANKTGPLKIITILTGYVDEDSVEKAKSFLKPHSERTFDIGYRARKVPYWLGQHGIIKWKLTEVFESKLTGSDLRLNLSNSYSEVFYGYDWHKFLCDCRVVLGCEGGASLHDPKGEIRQKVEDYVSKRPSAEFEEVMNACFPRKDNNISLFAISPRHFDSCIAKTCQVLVEGKYHGIFKANEHYIELKKDFSNLDEVIAKIRDRELCERIAEKAYQDVVLSGKYTYRAFIKSLLSEVPNNQPQPTPIIFIILMNIWMVRCFALKWGYIAFHTSKRKFKKFLLELGIFESLKPFWGHVKKTLGLEKFYG